MKRPSALETELGQLSDVVAACRMELEAAMMVFSAACSRQDQKRMVMTSDAVLAAQQAWLDATASQYAVICRRLYG